MTLEESIEAFYEAFRGVPKPRRISGCECCIAQEELDALLSVPLRQVDVGKLCSYASSTLLTVGSVADYLYLLPRIMELTCLDADWWVDMEITGRAIAETNPLEWPAKRLAALQNLLHAAINHQMVTEGLGWEIDDWICAIAKMGLDPKPYLQQLESSSSAVLSFYDQNASHLTQRKLGNAFWEPGEKGHDAVVAWFFSPTVSEIIFEAYGVRLASDKLGSG
ncbi:hypothetical protein NT6N_38700 [Oceaniferula spumae]|uniref:Uncharacterized protein n=1 Tax=Oceaniferula spumae TaxID=2979115 RepID=A0AAT9FS23_9BACT